MLKQSSFYPLAFALLFWLSCAATPTPQAQNEYTFTKYVSGIEVPWGMEWLSSGELLVTDRSGILYVVRDGEIVAEYDEVFGDLYPERQGGFLDVQAHPNYSENGWIYFSYSSTSGEGEGANTKIIRAKLGDNGLEAVQTLYKATPNSRRGVHYGSRLEFGTDGTLYFTIGDRGNRDVNPQSLSIDGGKVYRINDDGSIPQDNPFVGQDNAIEAVYSYGHRNQQGMERHPVTGQMWAHEHGPRGGDELNIIEPGKNYGWPVISYGINYNGTPFAEDTVREGMQQPIQYWVPSIAPSGMTFVTSDRYPDWKGHLLVGSLKFGLVELLQLDGNSVESRTEVLQGIGRVRSIKQGPDGYIYVGVTGQGIFRVEGV